MIKKEVLIREGINMAAVLLALTVVLKVIFLKESTATVAITAAAIMWLFVLPGFILMYYWHEKLEFIERLIIGTALGIAAIGVIGYNLSVIGLNMKYHAVMLPAAMLLLGTWVIVKR